MKLLSSFLLITLLLIAALPETYGTGSIPSSDQDPGEIPILNFEEFKSYLNKTDDQLYIINFWATWCAPCVAELPYFERIREEFSDRGVKVILVSLDFPRQYESRLVPFVKDFPLHSEVLMLNDPDANSWIPRVSERWTGSIPATLVYKSDQRQFYEKQLTYEELLSIIESFF